MDDGVPFMTNYRTLESASLTLPYARIGLHHKCGRSCRAASAICLSFNSLGKSHVDHRQIDLAEGN